MTLDLKKPEGQKIFLKLLQASDILIESFRVKGMEELGLSQEVLRQANPKLIHCSITGYGETGPWRERPAYDIALQAESGLMSITGQEGGEPVRVGVAVIDLVTSLMAVQSILAALWARQQQGIGQKIDIGLLDCGVAILSYMAGYYFATGKSPRRMGGKHPTIVPYQAIKTKDSWVVVAVGSEEIWVRFCKAIGREDLRDDSRFQANPQRVKNREALEEIIEPIFIERTTEEWLQILNKHDVPAAPVNDIEAVFQIPQLEARDMLKIIKHPTLGGLKAIGIPMKFEKTPCSIQRPPPLLGEHTEEILKELGYSAEDISTLKREDVI